MNKLLATADIELNNSSLPSHGGDLLSASRISGIPLKDILDFSVNTNPLGLPSCVAPLLGQVINDLDKYPSSESPTLKHALAESLGIDASNITVTNGSTEFIYLLPRIWDKGKTLLCVTPIFSEYERSFSQAGIQVDEYNLTPESEFMLDMNHFLGKLRGMSNLGGIALGSPNNPTGRLCNSKAILELLDFCEKKNIYLIVDETFIEFAGLEYSLAKRVEPSKILILVQSLTKFYALAGLRVGHGISSKYIADRITAIRPPWSVNVPAQTIGEAVLKDIEYQTKTREFIQSESQYLHDNLSSFKSIEVFSSNANFFLFRLLSQDENRPYELYTSLLQEGILIRNCANFKGLNASFFRVAVKKRTENEKLLSILKKHL